MCGISIAINKRNQRVAPEQIRAMNDKVSHRGPDDEGFFAEGHFAFGHRRLSILDLSPAGHQPMQRRNCWLTFNGEIYNYIELRDELKTLGHHFVSGSDTEVILAAYEQWGVDAFPRFNGMWAFAIYDSGIGEIILCRDHFGIKPLNFTITPDWFLAGSEIKQFTAFPDFKPVLNKEVAINFLVNGLLNYSDQTFFSGVSELRPGHYLRYALNSHRMSVHRWYDLDRASRPVKDPFEVAVGRTRELFLDSVRIRMRSDVPVGSCLSGGIDSSSMVSVIHSCGMANGTFATVTSCYEDARYDEQRFSDEVTRQTGYKALKVYPDLNHLWDQGHFDKMLYHQDQPFSTASHYSEFCVFREARNNRIIVMQDGQGSDEFLCGYGEFFVAYVRELLRGFRWRAAWRLLRSKAVHRQRTLGAELRAFLNAAYGFRLIRLAKRIAGRSDHPWMTSSWSKIAASSLVRFPEKNIRDLSLAEIAHSSIPYQLHSEDRNSMMFSIESRLPFLDPRLVEYGIGLPSSYKIGPDGYTKYVLREAIRELPESIRHRKDKMGFVAPDAPWITKNKVAVRKELEEVITRTGVFSDQLLDRFDRFIDGRLGYEPIYFRAMALNRFLKIFKMEINP
ncbi:MAG: asparagine synthase (glutamine-hydrolyzing) [Bacteroidota bacterium]|nr:asparagine synthase (glutamine-hydrolyzing) [Bacteroidota bacterium]